MQVDLPFLRLFFVTIGEYTNINPQYFVNIIELARCFILKNKIKQNYQNFSLSNIRIIELARWEIELARCS